MKMKFLLVAALFTGFFQIEAASQVAGDAGTPSVRTVSGGVLNGKATNLVRPEYPKAAMAVRASGAVNVQVTIDENGDVISAAAVSGHPLLRNASVAAARQSKFNPLMLSGQPVRVTGIIVYNFSPQENKGYRSQAQMFVPLGLPLILTSYKITDVNEEGRKMFRDLAQTLPDSFPEAKDSLEQLSRARTKSQRDTLIDELIGSMSDGLSGTDLWLAQLGKAWGDAVVAAFAIAEKDSKQNRRVFKGHLSDIHDLLGNPPEDVSPALVEQAGEISAFGDETYSQASEFVADFLKGSLSFADSLIKNK